MAIKEILITVKTYPLISKKHTELVCTAGIYEESPNVYKWIRIYPISFRLRPDTERYKKYDWVSVPLEKRSLQTDFRPESYQPSPLDADINVIKNIDTKNGWAERKDIVLKTTIHRNLSLLIEEAKNPTLRTSLATFKPSQILEFVVEEVEAEYAKEILDSIEARKNELFLDADALQMGSNFFKTVKKIPFKFSYRFVDEVGKESTLMIEDWEIGALYWNCLKRANGDKMVALQQVKDKYYKEIALTKDVYLFLGTTLQHHAKNAPNPFIIIGIFYPPFHANTAQQTDVQAVAENDTLKIKPPKSPSTTKSKAKKDLRNTNDEQPSLF